jgi:hypothetical protein
MVNRADFQVETMRLVERRQGEPLPAPVKFLMDLSSEKDKKGEPGDPGSPQLFSRIA